jgi:DNA invertase Pin-like site-specific DNA recombinase
MANVIRLRKGLDIHLQGKAEETKLNLKSNGKYALAPDDFEGVTPKVVVREGDTVIVTEYSRLARNVKDLLAIIDDLHNQNVNLVSIKENFDTSTPQGSLMLTIFAGLSEFEREMILQRQREGIAIAKRAGKYHGRKPLPFNEEEFRKECINWTDGKQTAVKTMSKLNMKPNRFYKKVKELGITKNTKNQAAV